MEPTTLAPIVVFAFRRPDHLRRTLESLLSNPEANRSPVWIHCDGPRNEGDVVGVAETRTVARSLDVPGLHVIEAERNRGLANSVIAGVSQACDRYGRVIVLEDDLLLAPTFLAYMNGCLERYWDDERVFQVSGHMFPVDLKASTDAVFLPFTTSWGWATWARAWKHFDPSRATLDALHADRQLRSRFDLDGAYPYFNMLERQMRGEVDSWAIRWYASVFLRSGLVLHPAKTLVANTGFDGSGTHWRDDSGMRAQTPSATTLARLPDTAVDGRAYDLIRRHLQGAAGGNRSLVARALGRLRRVLS